MVELYTFRASVVTCCCIRVYIRSHRYWFIMAPELILTEHKVGQILRQTFRFLNPNLEKEKVKF